jgi:hypothetical protein
MAVVVRVHPTEGGDLDRFEIAPRAAGWTSSVLNSPISV